MRPRLDTTNGEITLEPIFCGVTGRQLCWAYVHPFERTIPAYISFDIVDRQGKPASVFPVDVDMEINQLIRGND